MTQHSASSLASKHHLYSHIRDSIETGDLLAWRITRVTSIFDFVLVVYQKLFKAKFSHVAVAVRVGERLFAIEAVPKNVRIIPLSMLDNFYLVRAGIKPRFQHFDILSRHLGKLYGLFDLVKNLLRWKGDDSELFCSELALKFYEEIGYFIEQFDEFDDRIPTPDDIVERVLAESKGQIEFVRIDKGNLNVV